MTNRTFTRDQLTTPTPDGVTAALTGLLGARLVALLDTAEKRDTAHRVLESLADREGVGVARAWLIGMNPHLDDQAPLLAIAAGRFEAVQAAARAYLDGGAP